jgi:hypothetical protein
MISYTLHIEIGGHVTAYWQTEKKTQNFKDQALNRPPSKKTYKTNSDKKTITMSTTMFLKIKRRHTVCALSFLNMFSFYSINY